MAGPLNGIKAIEFAGIGPAPFAGMMLADMGADILRIERLGTADPRPTQFDVRGRRTIALDLKQPRSVALCLDLCETAELVFEGNRPGVMERLGLGPEQMLERSPRLVYGRMTGWGQHGTYSRMAGHDINYLALSGALHAIGTPEKPLPPLNLIADYGGGAMFLVAGLLAALIHARATGEGQTVDVAMTDGAAYLMSIFYGMHADGQWSVERGSNMLDGGAPFYDTYRCADGRWIAVGAIEPQFYALLLERTGLTERLDQPQWDQTRWPHTRQVFSEIFSQRTRLEWEEIFDGSDACVTPVLSIKEASAHQHNVSRKTFATVSGIVQPAPAPRFGATPAAPQTSPAGVYGDTRRALADWGAPETLLDILNREAG